jgi:hypothetical protein
MKLTEGTERKLAKIDKKVKTFKKHRKRFSRGFWINF